MKTIDRRTAMQAGAALAASTLTACAAPGRSGDAATPRVATQDNVLFDVPRPFVPIVGSNVVFPVRRIYCIGRNYAAHAREMGSDPNREPPFFFQKPSDAIQQVPVGRTIDHRYPSLTKNYHYELELVAALNSGGRDIRPEQALACVYGYAVGLDMTRRDLQRAMGDQKKPWEIGKSFDHAAPIGPIHPVGQVGHFTKGGIVLKVNGAVKQSADLSQMIWSVAEQIANLSQAFELFPGDIIYSGTPENVGPVVPGDVMLGHIDGLPDISVKVV